MEKYIKTEVICFYTSQLSIYFVMFNAIGIFISNIQKKTIRNLIFLENVEHFTCPKITTFRLLNNIKFFIHITYIM